MSIQSEQLKERTLSFAAAVLGLIDALPPSVASRAVASQLARAATSVAANYRSTCNARSRAEFVSRLGIVVEEADESVCWLELIRRRNMVSPAAWQPLLGEALELRAIFGKSLGTARANTRRAAEPHRAF